MTTTKQHTLDMAPWVCGRGGCRGDAPHPPEGGLLLLEGGVAYIGAEGLSSEYKIGGYTWIGKPN